MVPGYLEDEECIRAVTYDSETLQKPQVRLSSADHQI